MAHMLARFAGSLYWLGRYVTRAESLARLIDISKTYAGHDPNGANWRQVLRIYGDVDRFFEKNETADAASVLYFYLLDRTNPTSAAYAIAAAHENARGARHLISTEMWTHINIFRNQYQKLTARDLRIANVSNVCQQIKNGCQSFEGIVEGTMTRGEAWIFFSLGKQIERADQTTRVLDIGYLSLASNDDDAVASVHWNTLIRALGGYQAFRAGNPGSDYRGAVVSFLLSEDRFVRSVYSCFNEINRLIETIPPSSRGDVAPELLSLNQWIEEMDTTAESVKEAEYLHSKLDEFQMRSIKLSARIDEVFFAAE